MNKIRVRFAPSPTGALHIGGIRTALYNYLFAKKHGGVFILRIEDTDQARYLPGAEEYIIEALNWSGLIPTEGPGIGGDYGPYRQSERKAFYKKYALQLVDRGNAYYAFDTPEDLESMRLRLKDEGNHSPKYDSFTRMQMKNSLTFSEAEVKQLLESGANYTIRLNIPQGEYVNVEDIVRGTVQFQTNELDDKIILKADGMPTYHLANVVDDHLMKISHVIRGEEWLSSTAHHILMYRFFDWEGTMPQFAHLPLILKPNTKGKLSKRDGFKLGIPVFPISWKGDSPEDSFVGFREFGFDPHAMINFLAFLGWNPGTEQEIFSLDGLCEAFSLDRIGKSGARFDFEKAKWFNQQYIIASDDQSLASKVRPYLKALGVNPTDTFLTTFCGLMKERAYFYGDFVEQGYYFFTQVKSYDTKTIIKRWQPDSANGFESLRTLLKSQKTYDAESLELTVKKFISDNELKLGDVFSVLRVALSGTTKGPSLFDMMALLGSEEVDKRLKEAFQHFNKLMEEAKT